MAAPQISSIDQQKKELRDLMAEKRRNAPAHAEADLLERIFKTVQTYDAPSVAAVWPLPGEIDLRPLCSRLARDGRRVALPETTPKGTPLVFREWSEETPMLAGRFGTSHPDGPILVPELVLVPFLAFDRKGFRLGYGGGYYDRTLAQLNVPAIGFGFAFQEMKSIPVGPYDIPLSVIVTEKETIQTGPYNLEG
ncbi:5-formyltetrahydrofolate cyclo-ligase [Gluconobacter cerinus]|nr:MULTISPECIES: 5-formyltetrahydrofolate cyclo-ligase [Gluconobacter]MBS1039186.1 5-formyltetrahydrofolate cyclo-ligase [Gluconobacter cerinus]OUJ04929.1 5-formyltetrahydrofolate cyclo-ligase [Gluconobacter sp. DsW_058]